MDEQKRVNENQTFLPHVHEDEIVTDNEFNIFGIIADGEADVKDVDYVGDEFTTDIDEARTRALRGNWGNRVEFFLAIVGYTVGAGSVWRFPIVCSHNGGGAFLVPFFFFLIVSGGPLYYLEVCIGQFSGRSAGLAFGFCPLLKGLGFLQVSLSFVVIWYGICVNAWIYYYLYSSFASILPWTTCNNDWNTNNCKDSSSNDTSYLYNHTSANSNLTLLLRNVSEKNTPSFEFWEYKVIGKSSGLEDMGSLQPHLVICLVIAWILTVLAVIQGTKTLGKVVYVSATIPYLLLVVLFIRGLMLEGAIDGIAFYLNPDFSYLLKIKTWQDAALQVFYSLGPTWGGVITMASYNKFREKSFWSSTLCVASAGFTSFFNGLVVFTIIGFTARESGSTVEQIATQSGTGLVFVAFPIALGKMPLPQFWSVLFFLMLVTVTFDSIFGMFETVTGAIIDLFPSKLTSKRVYVNICVGVFLIVTGLPLCLNGGIYILQLLDCYAPRFALLLGSFIECVAVFWIYGLDRFCNDIVVMTGRRTSTVLRVMWSVVTPVLVGISFLFTLTDISTPAYGDGYIYSSGAIAVGVLVGLIPVIGLVTYAIFVLARAEGTFCERMRSSIQPDNTWKPNDNDSLVEYMKIPYTYPSSLRQRLLVDFKGTGDSYQT